MSRTKEAPAEGPSSRRHGHKEYLVTRISVPKAKRLRIAGAKDALKEAEDRYNHELMDDEERVLLLEKIKRLRNALAKRG